MRSILVRTVVVLVFGGVVALAGGCARHSRFEFTRVCMGVQTTVTTHAASMDDAVAAALPAFDVIERVDWALSDYRFASDAMQFCDHADTKPGEWLPIAGDLREALVASRHISDATDGAFSVAIGPAVHLWRAARQSGQLPDEASRLEAVRLSDWRNIELDPAAEHARTRVPGVRLDFGGIGKGYAAQAAINELKRRGSPRSMVALAGDIAVGDPPPGERGWRINVREGMHDLLLTNSAVSTSGDSEQFVEINGKKYSHIVDVHTGLGFPAPRGIQVTVVATHGAIADALGTALYALPVDSAPAMLQQFHAAAIITRTEKGNEPRIEIIDPHHLLRWAR